MSRKLRGLVVVVTGSLVAVMVNVAPASATVSDKAATWTPKVTSSNATVRKMWQCGGTMYAVGSFSKITQGSTSYTRLNAFSFSATTGAVTSWNPNVNGEVSSIATSASCATAYLGGAFSKIGATTVRNIAAVNTSTGAVITAFGHTASGSVSTVAMVNAGRDLMVGGSFTGINGSSRHYYASLDPTTGAVNNYLTAVVAGRLPPDAGGTKVYNQQVSPSGTHLLFEGDFTTIGGQPRLQLAELNLSSTAATVNPWFNQTLNTTYCAKNEQFFGRAAAFSPDEKTIYLATTGFKGSSPYCDAVTAFTNTAPATVKWMNKTGGDSLYAVAAGPNDVYIGGHERWANNPHGSDSCGTGCVSRPGIADINATTGLATSWNPTRARGHGADDLLITPAGLWVSSDTFFNSNGCAGASHPGICFFPGAA